MRRPPRLGLALPLLAALAGCSVFGIATEKDLDELTRRQARQQESLTAEIRSLQDQLASIAGDLESVQARLEPRLSGLETDLQTVDAAARQLRVNADQLAQRLAAAREQLQSLEGELLADMDSVRHDVSGMQGDVALVRSAMDTVQEGLGDAAVKAEAAALRSERALRAYYTALIEERERIAQRLQILDQRIRTWEAEDPVLP